MLSYETTKALIQIEAARDHNREVRETAQLLLTELDDAETGQRGYLITGKEPYLQPYNEATKAIRQTVRSLDRSIHSPFERQEMEQLKPLIAMKLAELQETIDLRRTKGFAAADQIVLSNRGKRAMDEIRKVIGAMIGREDVLLDQGRSAAQSSASRALIALAGGGLLSVGLLLFVFIVLTQEIRLRKRTEEALRESEERLLLVIEGVKGYAIFMLDPEGNVLTWNAGAERLKGYRADEIIGKHFSIFYTPEDAAAGKPAHELAAAEAESRTADEGWRVRKDGSRFWASVTITALRDDAGKLRGFSKITRDDTVRHGAEEAAKQASAALARRTAELEAANKELEAFTYSVSHDLRAPLRHVDGFSKLLLEENAASLSDEAKRYLGFVREGVIQMGRLVDDLLNLARVGRKELSVQVAGLNSLADEVMAELKHDCAARSIEWKVQPLPFVECDPALMKQVFANLLSNAVKYTRPRERAVIEVGTAQENGQAVVYVRDNGVGFNMKYADKLFGVFQRLHRSEDFEGTGVGLATVQRIIHKHGGRIWAKAALDQGATFYFTVGKAESRESKNEI